MGYNNGSWGLGSKGGGSGGSGGTTGWEDMLAQNQAQAADHSIDVNGFNLSFVGADSIDIETANGFGNLSDGTWVINNDGSFVFGTLSSNQNLQYDGGNLVLLSPSYPDGIFTAQQNGVVILGDYIGDVHNTYLESNDIYQNQAFNANNGFQFTGANYPNGFTSINPNTRQVYIGDYATTQSDNGTYLLVDDGNSLIATQYNGLPLGMKLDFGAQQYWIGNAGGTYAKIDDNFGIGSQSFNALGGYQFMGGSTISSDGDLSLMGGDAGIFADGSLKAYDVSSTDITLQTDGNGDFTLLDKNTGNYSLQTDGNGDFTLLDKNTGNYSLQTNGNGDFTTYDAVSGNTTLQTDGNGNFGIYSKSPRNNGIFYVENSGGLGLFDNTTNYMTFRVDQNGLQTVDAAAGFGTMSPSWELGTVTTGVPTLTTPSYINVNIGGVPTQIPCFQ